VGQRRIQRGGEAKGRRGNWVCRDLFRGSPDKPGLERSLGDESPDWLEVGEEQRGPIRNGCKMAEGRGKMVIPEELKSEGTSHWLPSRVMKCVAKDQGGREEIFSEPVRQSLRGSYRKGGVGGQNQNIRL